MANARDLRLKADYESLIALVNASEGNLEIESVRGRPPDQYILIFHCRSIEALLDGKPIYSDRHRVQVKLPARYPLPSAPPRLEMLTPLFNPHVYPNREICLGNWQSSEYLDELVVRIGALLQWDRRILNLRDPANEQAMDWLKKNLILLPTDTRVFGKETPRLTPSHIIPEMDEQPDAELEWVDQ